LAIGLAWAQALQAGSLTATISRDCKIRGTDKFAGGERTRFTFEGCEAWVVEPPAGVKRAEGCPWTWTMQWATAFVPRTPVSKLLAKWIRPRANYMWQAGKAVGTGGPWKDTSVKARTPSDAYLMNGFDRKSLDLVADRDVTVTLEVDVDGWGTWVKAADYRLRAGEAMHVDYPRAFGGYWARVSASADCTATAQFTYL